MDEILVTQIGLLLNQFRYTRRALEDIERSTARYGGVTFALALAEGPRFGAPPLVGGALKVHVTNINDLTVSPGGVGLFEGLLGGIGRFIGGLGGGLVGGFIGGIALWVWVGKLENIVKGINEILDRLGIMGPSSPKEGGKTEKTDWPAMLDRFRPMIVALTKLFDAASSGPEAAAKSGAGDVSDQALAWGDQLAKTLTATTDTLNAADKLAKTLMIFVPTLVGALAWLVSQLDPLKLAFLDFLQFLLRISLILRGAVLVTIYDTLSAAAKLGAGILEILKTNIQKILDAVLTMIGAVLNTVEELMKSVGSGLANAMNSLLEWLVNGLGRVLTYIGDLRIFRLVIHLVQVLPNLLPSLIKLVYGNDVSLSKTDRDWLEKIKGKAVPGPTGPALTGKLPPEVKFPDLGSKLLENVQPFKDSLKATSETLPKKTTEAFDAAKSALIGIDKKMQDALTRGETGFESKLGEQMGKVRGHAGELAKALTPAAAAAGEAGEKGKADAGLLPIAKAYESWLAGGGLNTVLGQITKMFTAAPVTTPPAGAAGPPAAVVGLARPEPPRATVEIGEIVIEIEAPKPQGDTRSPASKRLGLPHKLHIEGYDERSQRGQF